MRRAVLGAACACALMPLPAELVRRAGFLPVAGGLAPHQTAGRDADGRIRGAAARLRARWAARAGTDALPEAAQPPLEIACGDMPPRDGWRADESYVLEIAPDRVRLAAPATEGILRGLATLTQWLEAGPGERNWRLPCVEMRDAPRFPWRGLMIDVARHWQPADVIRRNLDAMELVKLNVLHLHLTDDQGFRVESRTHPELARQGSDGAYFTQAQIRELEAYAWARGIRVVPEFDLPGHATSWAVSHPELASAPGRTYRIERRWGVFDPVLDPTNPAVYALLNDFLGEMAGLFTDPFLHIGGDENNGVQWDANPRIQAYIRAHGLRDDAGLQSAFTGRLAAILAAHGKRMIGWDEILHAGLPPGSVIQSWRGADGVAAAARAGYDVILSHGYYIDLGHPASEHYPVDPLPADAALPPAAAARVLGGEATMWSEWVSPETIDSRIWPRAAAIAERLWSPSAVRDTADMYRRLAVIDRRLAEAGTRQRTEPLALAARLAGPGADPVTVQAIATVATAFTPVQNYRRGHEQPAMDQTRPLTTFADAAVPDSPEARAFAEAVARYVAAPGAAAAVPVRTALARWSDAARRLLAFARHRGWPDGVAAAAALAEACALAETPPPAAATAALALAPLAAPHAATDLAILPAIRTLAAHPLPPSPTP